MSDKKKGSLWKLTIVLLLLIAAIAAPFIIALTSSYTVLIKNTDSRYFIAKDILIAGDYLFCIRDSIEHKKRKNALAGNEHDYNFALLSIDDVVYIEVIPDGENISSADAMAFSKMYLGIYKVDVSGNSGYLYLRLKRGKLYGTIRFPDWAHGVFEPLKNLWIKNGRIGFIRSVDSTEEARRIGAPTFFTQEFHGEYKNEGNVIEGYYLNRGAKMMWRGYKSGTK